MVGSILRKIFGSKARRDIKRLEPLVEEVNSLEITISKLSDEELRARTDESRRRVSERAKEYREELESAEERLKEAISPEERQKAREELKGVRNKVLEDVLPEAFAVVREVAKRTLNMRHFDVQIIGGVVLHEGKIAEMATGEGKTLVATLPIYLNSLGGYKTHLVTVNDYLAKRDANWMGPIYKSLGLTVGLIQHDMAPSERRMAYSCDVTYVTNNELGFDYLRDNMAHSLEECVLGKLEYAIVDEVDSILIDEARTPLIISGPAEESTNKYYIIDRLAPRLKGKFVTEREQVDAKYKGEDLEKGYDYIMDEKAGTGTLTELGVKKCERMLGVDNLYDDIQTEWVHHINQMIRAHNLFKRDVHYVVKDGQVIIVDEFTGRLMPGRRWSDGLHQAIEAKENLRIAEENQTLATITFQNYFKLYDKLAGMTGTAATEAEEFWKIYGLDVVVIPTNKPLVRTNYPDIIYKTEKEKFEAVIREIEELHRVGRPVLVGTRSIENSEKLSEMLKRKGIAHNVLNAKYHEREAQIVTQAGSKDTVTIATNMAGRGTDIVLGGNPPDPAEHNEVVELGGLHILGTERHEARRIDNQLRGRAGRQGDPGSSRFYLSLEDELMRLFGSARIAQVMDRLGLEEGQDIQHPLITRAIESAQKKVEAMNFDIRKQLLEYDNVMSKKREVVYKWRRKVLEGANLKDDILVMFEDLIDDKLFLYAPPKVYPEQWNWEAISEWLKRSFNISFSVPAEDLKRMKPETLGKVIAERIIQAYDEREGEMGEEMMRFIERMVTLQVVDTRWKDHLYDMDKLREGIGLRAYGQKDPLTEYQKESEWAFDAMQQHMREEISGYIFRVKVVAEQARARALPTRDLAQKPPAGVGKYREMPAREAAASASSIPTPFPKRRKIGRNDPCPCGSGKKYKKCCGR
ncbi:MAG: preprotein translocase subunit SecA [bacterium]